MISLVPPSARTMASMSGASWGTRLATRRPCTLLSVATSTCWPVVARLHSSAPRPRLPLGSTNYGGLGQIGGSWILVEVAKDAFDRHPCAHLEEYEDYN